MLSARLFIFETQRGAHGVAAQVSGHRREEALCVRRPAPRPAALRPLCAACRTQEARWRNIADGAPRGTAAQRSAFGAAARAASRVPPLTRRQAQGRQGGGDRPHRAPQHHQCARRRFAIASALTTAPVSDALLEENEFHGFHIPQRVRFILNMDGHDIVRHPPHRRPAPLTAPLGPHAARQCRPPRRLEQFVCHPHQELQVRPARPASAPLTRALGPRSSSSWSASGRTSGRRTSRKRSSQWSPCRYASG